MTETVRRQAANSAVLILRSAHAQALPQSRKSVRASRRMRTATAWPSCFETHRSALRPRKRLCSRYAATLLSMRASVVGGGLAKRSHRPEEATCGCRNGGRLLINRHLQGAVRPERVGRKGRSAYLFFVAWRFFGGGLYTMASSFMPSGSVK